MITTVTQEMQTNQRTGFNYWTIPGKIECETLDHCVNRVFGTDDIERQTRQRNIVEARHFKRFVLERLTKDGKITDKPRCKGHLKMMMYGISNIAKAYRCDHASIIYSSRVTKTLMETDKTYRAKVEKVLLKIELNLIKFPEL